MDSLNNTFHYSPEKEHFHYNNSNNSGTFLFLHWPTVGIDNHYKSEAPDEEEEANTFNNYNSFEKSPYQNNETGY